MYVRPSIVAAATALVLASLTSSTVASTQIATGTFSGCPARGSGGDPELNELKNRSTLPPSVSPITVDGMKQLPRLPAGTPAMRASWPASARATIHPHENEAVAFTGYIVRVEHETGDPSNCASSLPQNEDVELFLAERNGVTDGSQIILAEVTPRWRAVYTSWRTANLRRIAADGSRVRISGWLIYDEESWRETNGGTATPWEIEPITRIQLWRNGSWASY